MSADYQFDVSAFLIWRERYDRPCGNATGLRFRESYSSGRSRSLQKPYPPQEIFPTGITLQGFEQRLQAKERHEVAPILI